MSRLQQTFDRLRAGGRGGLVAYLTAGDPDPAESAAIVTAWRRPARTFSEIGVPFSDPLADGPVIQRAIERALAAGMTLRGSLELVRRVGSAVDTPIVLFTYANPVLRMDARAFARAAADAGVDGVLILDYPVEEVGAASAAARRCRSRSDFPGESYDDRCPDSAVGELGRGFLYVISRLGVTGMRDRLASDVPVLLERVRAASSLPIAVGFGISSPEHVAEACRAADAAVVGSALVDTIARNGSSDVCAHASEYVEWLKSSL